MRRRDEVLEHAPCVGGLVRRDDGDTAAAAAESEDAERRVLLHELALHELALLVRARVRARARRREHGEELRAGLVPQRVAAARRARHEHSGCEGRGRLLVVAPAALGVVVVVTTVVPVVARHELVRRPLLILAHRVLLLVLVAPPLSTLLLRLLLCVLQERGSSGSITHCCARCSSSSSEEPLRCRRRCCCALGCTWRRRRLCRCCCGSRGALARRERRLARRDGCGLLARELLERERGHEGGDLLALVWHAIGEHERDQQGQRGNGDRHALLQARLEVRRVLRVGGELEEALVDGEGLRGRRPVDGEKVVRVESRGGSDCCCCCCCSGTSGGGCEGTTTPRHCCCCQARTHELPLTAEEVGDAVARSPAVALEGSEGLKGSCCVLEALLHGACKHRIDEARAPLEVRIHRLCDDGRLGLGKAADADGGEERLPPPSCTSVEQRRVRCCEPCVRVRLPHCGCPRCGRCGRAQPPPVHEVLHRERSRDKRALERGCVAVALAVVLHAVAVRVREGLFVRLRCAHE